MGARFPQWSAFLGIGLVFGLLASAMAYLILYEEYVRHCAKPKARRMSMQGAVFAFLFFSALAFAAGYLLTAAIQ